jgi:halimadienyl-diphosphate synthase
MYNLITALQDNDHLSPCLYSTAICSLNNPQRSQFLAWLLKQRNPDGTWGHDLSWQDMYLTTYAVALALIDGGWDALATHTLDRLARLPAYGTDNRTLNFGGLIGTLDVFAQAKLGVHVEHPTEVNNAMIKETGKWAKISQHGEFYNPAVSIAGFFGECCYGLYVDLPRFLQSPTLRRPPPCSCSLTNRQNCRTRELSRPSEPM